MIKKLAMKIVLLSSLVVAIFIISTRAIQTQPQNNPNNPVIKSQAEPHQDTKVLLAIVEKLNAQIDSIVYLLTIDIPKTDSFLVTIEKRLNQIDNDAKAHGASLLIDTVKLSALRETVLYYRSIADCSKK